MPPSKGEAIWQLWWVKEIIPRGKRGASKGALLGNVVQQQLRGNMMPQKGRASLEGVFEAAKLGSP